MIVNLFSAYEDDNGLIINDFKRSKFLKIVINSFFSVALNAAPVSDQEVAKFIESCNVEDDGGLRFDSSLNQRSI